MKTTAFLLTAIFVSVVSSGRERIVGGHDAEFAGRWPWQASLQMRSSGRHICGASLVSRQHLVTAAHCVSSGARNLKVVLGLYDRTTKKQGQPQEYDISRITTHRYFRLDGKSGFPNDVAILKLRSAVDFSNPFVSTIRLAPEDGHTYIGDECYITGWGRLSGSRPPSNVLQEAKIEVMKHVNCRKIYGSKMINPGHICVLEKSRFTKGACNGDSGGPLACRREDGLWYLAGITSWVHTGCLTSFPTVYSRVSYFNEWFSKTI